MLGAATRSAVANHLNQPIGPTVQMVRFFAVGTNMDEECMRSWIPSARRLTIASLSGFSVRWHKRSSDGGKLAALHTGHPDDVIWGVVYDVDGVGLTAIDEGQRSHGYRDERVTVVGLDGDEHDASVYVAGAEMIDDSMMPTRSYRDPIVKAARANGLPAEYVDELARTAVVDSSAARTTHRDPSGPRSSPHPRARQCPHCCPAIRRCRGVPGLGRDRRIGRLVDAKSARLRHDENSPALVFAVDDHERDFRTACRHGREP